MLPSLIPIFPLPNTVLFPSVFLPLHIFEPRYRRMVEDALVGDRIIGMVLLRRGWEAAAWGPHPHALSQACAAFFALTLTAGSTGFPARTGRVDPAV